VQPEGPKSFGIVLYTDGGWQSLIGKVYPSNRQDLYQVLEGLKMAGFGPEAQFSIPRPVAYLSSLRLLLVEKVDGIPAKQIFKHGDEHQRASAAERCGQWLAQFHAVAPLSGQVFEVATFLRRIEAKVWTLSEAGRLFAAKAEQLLESLKATGPALRRIPGRAGHGDFGSYHVILPRGRTVVIDWDLYDIADPSRDVARFIVSLKRQAQHKLESPHVLESTAEVFLRTYLASGGPPQVASNLPFYKAAFCLKGAIRDVEAKIPEWHERTEFMLDEGLRLLREGGERERVGFARGA